MLRMMGMVMRIEDDEDEDDEDEDDEDEDDEDEDDEDEDDEDEDEEGEEGDDEDENEDDDQARGGPGGIEPGPARGVEGGVNWKVSRFPTVLLPAYSLLKQEQLQLAQPAFVIDICICIYIYIE